jgi:hypothetical protein
MDAADVGQFSPAQQVVIINSVNARRGHTSSWVARPAIVYANSPS